MIRLYDTMARKKREFKPADPSCITMYVCGPTVYGRAHIGNARPAVVFDTLARLIRHVHPERELIYARNVTDVDDKIIAAAEAEGVGYRIITERYYKHYVEDMAALNVLPPDFEPRATAFVPRMIEMIQRLIVEEYAYCAEGHVLFEVAKDPTYGALSGRDREAILAGARVEVAPYKRDPADFVLWKPAGDSAEQVALSFPSPWGFGRPGWHIECSAMIEALGETRNIGETIDIHGGGLDLIFPHHENEIAQSRCAHNGAKLAEYWVHNGFVDMGTEKMSKSLGNIITVDDLLANGHHGSVLRLALLSAHYRKPLRWDSAVIGRNQRYLDRLRGGYRRWKRERRTLEAVQRKFPIQIVTALSDDLNTPRALHDLKQLAGSGDWEGVLGAATLLGIDDYLERSSLPKGTYRGRTLDWWLRSWLHADERGDFSESMRIVDYLHSVGVSLDAQTLTASYTDPVTHKLVALPISTSGPSIDSPSLGQVWTEQNILRAIEARNEAKRSRNFIEADRIREQLKRDKIILEDRADGETNWHQE